MHKSIIWLLIKKYTIFVLSLWNLVMIIISWVIKLLKYLLDSIKIVNFSLLAIFWACALFLCISSIYIFSRDISCLYFFWAWIQGASGHLSQGQLQIFKRTVAHFKNSLGFPIFQKWNLRKDVHDVCELTCYPIYANICRNGCHLRINKAPFM